jgi:hypothetical protein
MDAAADRAELYGPDWADKLAHDIAMDFLRFSRSYAQDLTAAKLRLVRNTGRLEVAERTHAIVTGNNADLQSEYVADVEKFGIDGWGGQQ